MWHKAVHLAKSVDLVSETVVRWFLDVNLLWDSWHFDFAKWELVAILSSVPELGEVINTLNHIEATVGMDVALWSNLIGGQVVITNEVLSWLVDIKTIWELLSSKKKGEGITSIVRVMNLTNFDGIVGEVVVNNKWKTFALAEESQNLAIVVKELLLRGNLASSKSFLKELFHLTVSLWWNLNL